MSIYEGMLSMLDIFNRPLVNRNVVSNKTKEYHPIAPISSSLQQLEYIIPGTSYYIDLTKLQIKLRAKLLHEDGTDVDAAETKVSLSNLPISSFFSQAEAYLMTKPVQSSNSLYPYLAYLMTLLNYGSEAKKSQLTAWGYYADEPSDPTEAFAAADDAKNGIKKRANMVKQSNVFEVQGPLFLDVSKLDKYLVNDVDVRIRLIRATNAFSIISTEPNKRYKIELLEATIYVRNIEVQGEIMLAHASVMQKTPAIYPITNVTMKSFVIMANSTDSTYENLFLGMIPNRVVIGLVSNKALNGSFDTNPFDFKHYTLKFLQLNIGTQNYPAQAFTPNFKNGKPLEYTREYLSLFDAMGTEGDDRGNAISYQQYLDGNVLYAFDLTREHMGSANHSSVTQSGSARLALKFEDPLPENVSVIVMAEFESEILISQEREVVYTPQ